MQKIKQRILRGSYKQLKRFCKFKNLPNSWIKEDKIGYYVKLSDRGDHS